jgi:hypothetical protein
MLVPSPKLCARYHCAAAAAAAAAAGIPDVVHLAHYVPHKQGANITFEPDWQKQAVLGHEQLLEMAVVPGTCIGVGGGFH